MIDKIKNDLVEVFLEDKNSEVLNLSAINLALFKILKSEYFNNAYNDFYFLDRGDNFYQIGTTINEEMRVTICDPLEAIYFHDDYFYGDEDEISDEEYQTMLKNEVLKPECKTNIKVENIQNQEIIDRANKYIEKLKEKNELYIKILDNDFEIIQSRYDIQITKVNDRSIYDFLENFFGKNYDSTLKTSFINYYSDLDNREDMTYFIAHNDFEIAGLLSIKHNRESCNVLSFVSVANSFREKGISKTLYKKLIEECEKEKKILVRSSPSKFTRENPHITESYNNLLLDSNILHVTSGYYSLIEEILSNYYNKIPYNELVKIAKKHCDKSLENDKKLSNTDNLMIAEELKSVLEKTIDMPNVSKYERIKIK